MEQCPRCGIQVNELQSPPGDLQQKLAAVGISVGAPVCMGCLSDLAKEAQSASTSAGVLMAHERAKEQHKLQLWKSRVGLLKKAQSSMSQKMFTEAAVSYEKYLKVLELVFEVKKGDRLEPGLFKESARNAELTVVASVYWDLLRIYDGHESYMDRMQMASHQLAAFVPFTPIYGEIAKKAESFARSAKHPQIVKQLVKEISKGKSGCFIATVCYGGENTSEVLFLRQWRDDFLLSFSAGRAFVLLYYQYSPRWAKILKKHAFLRKGMRFFLDQWIFVLRLFS